MVEKYFNSPAGSAPVAPPLLSFLVSLERRTKQWAVSGGTNTCTTLSTTTRNKVGTGDTVLSEKFPTEVQALIAFASNDSRFIIGRGASMTESMIERLMVQLCFGNEEEPDEEVLC